MKRKNKNGKKNIIRLNYEVDDAFSTSVKNGEVKVVGYVDEKNFSDFVNHYMRDILDAIPTKSLGKVESYIKQRMEEKPILDNNKADKHEHEVFSNEQFKYIEQHLKGYGDVNIEDICFGKPTETVYCFVISDIGSPNIVRLNRGYFDVKRDAFMFYPVTNGECVPIESKVLGYIPFKRNQNCKETKTTEDNITQSTDWGYRAVKDSILSEIEIPIYDVENLWLP